MIHHKIAYLRIDLVYDNYLIVDEPAVLEGPYIVENNDGGPSNSSSTGGIQTVTYNGSSLTLIGFIPNPSIMLKGPLACDLDTVIVVDVRCHNASGRTGVAVAIDRVVAQVPAAHDTLQLYCSTRDILYRSFAGGTAGGATASLTGHDDT